MNTKMNKQTIDDDEITEPSDALEAPIATPLSKSAPRSEVNPQTKNVNGTQETNKPLPKESPRRWFVFQVVVSSILFFGTIAIVILLVNLKTPPSEITDGRQDPLVECITVVPYKENINISVSGIAVPFREINIAAEVTGAITEKTEACESGRFVRKGTELLAIDSEKYQLAKDRLVAELTEAEARQNKANAELEGARAILELLDRDLTIQTTEYKTRESLFQNNAISKTEWTTSQRAMIAAENAKKVQSNRVATLEADLSAQKSLVALKKIQQKEAEIDFKKATIKAPSDGVIITESVQKDDFVQAGTPLLVFEDTSAVEVKCDLRADQLQTVLNAKTDHSDDNSRFKLPPLEAKIFYKGNNEKFEWSGVLSGYDGFGLDERTRTAPCRILVKNTKSENGNRTLVRGMFVSVELVVGDRDGLLAVPANALRAGNMVWVTERYLPPPKADEIIEESDKKGYWALRKKSVQVMNRRGSGDDAIVIIKADRNGLQAGQSVILSSIPQATDLMKLRVNPTPAIDGDSQGSDGEKRSTLDNPPTFNANEKTEMGEPSK
jgi:multidrug efflux pump subunit AcrA (membrane-fusion protein)